MKLSRLFGVFAALVLSVLWTVPASAQATRTWVSGVGDDANPCSRTAPCKTFAGAISKTANGGEIDALDPGGFGALTITKSITLDGGGGQVASVLVAGTNGIVVAAQPTDFVILRNLRLDGLLGNGSSPGSAGINGIRWTSGLNLRLENDYIFGFNTSCIDDESSTANSLMVVVDTRVANCAVNGVLVHGGGNVTAKATFDNLVSDQSGIGLQADDGSRVFIHNSELSANNGDGVLAAAPSAAAFLSIDHSTVSANGGNGIHTTGGSATVVMSDTDVMANLTNGILGPNVNTYSNNHINNNAGANAPTGGPIGPQ